MLQTGKATIYKYRYLLIIVLTFAYSIQYLDRVKTNVLMPYISKDIGLTTVAIGLGTAIMMLCYGPAQLVTGWICDRIGSKKIMLFSILSWSALTYWMGEIQTVGEYYFRMALFGILIGTEFIPSARLLIRYFPRLQRASAQSVLSWAWIITPAWGTILATSMYVSLANSWRSVFHVLAFFGIIPLLLVLVFVLDKPEKNRFVGTEEIIESYQEELDQGLITEEDIHSDNVKLLGDKSKQHVPFSRVLRTRGFIPLTFVYSAAQLAYWGVMTWSAIYLVQVHHFSVMKMGVWASVYFVGGALGALASGWVSDHVLGGRRKPMLFLCFSGMIPFVIVLATLNRGVSPAVLLLTLTGAGFFSNMVWGPAVSLPADMFPIDVYGKAMGFVNCFAYMIGASSPYIMGWLVKMDPVTKQYSYFWAWMWVGCTALIGIVATSRLVDRKRAAPVERHVIPHPERQRMPDPVS